VTTRHIVQYADVEPVRVESFKPRAFMAIPVQLWRNGWTGEDQVIRFAGRCVTCDRPTWDRHGDNDPRGVLGDSALSALVATEYEMTGPDVVQCALCANEEPSYKHGLSVARRDYWTYPETADTEEN